MVLCAELPQKGPFLAPKNYIMPNMHVLMHKVLDFLRNAYGDGSPIVVRSTLRGGSFVGLKWL